MNSQPTIHQPEAAKVAAEAAAIIATYQERRTEIKAAHEARLNAEAACREPEYSRQEIVDALNEARALRDAALRALKRVPNVHHHIAYLNRLERLEDAT